MNISFENVCRLCLQPCEFNRRLDDRNFREKAQDILVLYLKIDDEHITIVCDSCQSQVESFYQFKWKCRENEKNRPITKTDIAASGAKPAKKALNTKPRRNPRYVKKTDRVYRKQVRFTKEQLATKTRRELYRERNRLNSKERYRKVCELCGKSVNDTYIEEHMNKHQGVRPYACDATDCGKTFGGRMALKKHIMYRHSDGEHPCQQCSKMYTNETALRIHIRKSHQERTIFCKQCDFSCVIPYELKTHMLVHTQQRDHRCEFCGKAFYSKQVLELHRRSHTGERPYACHVCDYSHAHRILYVKHMQKFHPGEEIRKLAEIQQMAKAQQRMEQEARVSKRKGT